MDQEELDQLVSKTIALYEKDPESRLGKVTIPAHGYSADLQKDFKASQNTILEDKRIFWYIHQPNFQPNNRVVI
jgi:hypothetical protein